MEKSLQRNLIRRDILDYEQRLCDCLSEVFPFESHAIYFPPDSRELDKPKWLPDEQKLLLPLRPRSGELLGVFMVRHPDPERIEAILPVLPGIASLSLENLSLYKTARTDPQTGLATKEVLKERLKVEAEFIQNSFLRGPEDTDDDRPHVGSMGLIAVRCTALRELEKDTGYAFAEQMLVKLATSFSSVLPSQALGARTGDVTFAAFLPEADHLQCENLGKDILQAMAQVRLPDPLSGRQIGVQISIGYALYPQDMDGTRLRDMNEHAPVLLQKAELAAEVAHTRVHPFFKTSPRIMAYGHLLSTGGEIDRLLPLSRVTITLGYRVGAREGQHFSVWTEKRDSSDEDPEAVYKGEIVILDARESDSVAEILNIGDPVWSLEPGDMLSLIPNDTLNREPKVDTGSFQRPDATGLLRHGDFLARLAKARVTCKSFALALVNVNLKPIPVDIRESFPKAKLIPYADRPDHLMASLADMCRRTFTKQSRLSVPGFNEAAFGGRFGLNNLIFFHPEPDQNSFRASYESLCTNASKQLGLRVAAGLAMWPFLCFHQRDMLECVRKALEYALLLPAPHVGVFDSLALNISADKKHCIGDVFGAIEEYKLALLADESNALAWNSLGVCMATLGRPSEARHNFEEAMRRDSKDPSPAYNLGALCQKLGELDDAEKYFHICLKLDSNHMYAKVRLGQIAEASGHLDKAIACFLDAADMDKQSSLPYRHLARLALRQNRKDRAREYLHQALMRNPRNAAALTMMAQLYLDGGEDTELAESLARQSVNQNPDRKSAWLVLAQSLEVQGKHSEAQKARLKAEL